MTNVEISEKKISEIFNAIPCVGPPTRKEKTLVQSFETRPLTHWLLEEIL
jgi:hypothetical protein